MNRRKILWGSIGLVILVAGILFFAMGGGDEEGIVRVERGEFEKKIDATGKLEAAIAYEIGPPSMRDQWSYNLTWMIPEGRRVTKGTVVARFDTTDLDERLRVERAELETTQQEREKEERSLQVSLKDLKLDLVKAEGDAKRVALDASVPAELVSSIEVEQKQLEKALNDRRVEFLTEKTSFEQKLVDSKLELLEVKQRFHQERIDYYEKMKESHAVKAPVDGLIVYVPKGRGGGRWEIGESVWMMAKVLKVADVSTLQVEATVLEVDASKVSPGQKARIMVDALPGTVLESKVQEIGQIVRERSPQDRSKVFDVILPLESFDPELLRPGMGVQVEVTVETLPDVLKLPVEAIDLRPEGPGVWKVSGGGANWVPVELGPRNSQEVVILGGLEEGDRVEIKS